MVQPVLVQNSDQLARFCRPPGLPALNPETIGRHQADAHWLLVDPAGQVSARCSLWWRDPPPMPGRRIGLIGHYAARNAGAASQLLPLAGEQLGRQGCTTVVGPMDGNTWRNYRLVTKRGRELPFFLEPDNPDDWPAHFTGNGFTVLTHYFSTLNPDLGRNYQDLSKVTRRAARRGIKIRPFKPDCFEAELQGLYHIALASFSRNFLYTPLTAAEFMAMYQPLRPYIRFELILIAEYNDQPIGFIFALPDLLQAHRNEVVDTIIIKTVAVHPDHQVGGLGSLLVARCQEAAHNLGYKRAIHALMHETNASRKISHRHGTDPIRQYALFAKELSC